MAPRLMWIGLGNMGRGMCKNLVERGTYAKPLIVFNRSPKRTEAFAQKLPPGSVEVADSIEGGVAKADIIFTCISDDAAVRDTLSAASTLDIEGKLFVECSTIHPETTEAVAKTILGKHAEFVAAPVFGAPAAADAGQLVCVLAGPRTSVNKARPFFKGVMGRAEIDLADEPYSKALTLKVLGNTFILNMIEQLSEGYVAAEKCGLGTGPLLSFIEAIFPGVYVTYSGRMLTGDYHKREEPLFAVDLARKDARHAISLAKSVGVSLPNVETAEAHLSMVREHSGPNGDLAGVYGAVRKEAGLKFENDA